jgi:ribosomal protein S28E/S33
MSGAVQDILVRVGARTSVSQVRAESSHELKRRGVHREIVSKLIGPNGKVLMDDSIGPYYSEALADAIGGSCTEGGMVLVLRDMAGAVQDILVRVGASTSVSQVRAEASHELKLRGVHREIVSKLIGPNGKVLMDDSIGPYYFMHRAEAQTQLSFEIGELIASEGLDEKESDGDIVIQLREPTLDEKREKDILIRVSASSTGLQVRAGVLSELKRRGVRKKLQNLFYLCHQEEGRGAKYWKDLKDDEVVGAVQLNASRPMGYVHTVVYMFLADDESRRVFTTEQEAVILAGIKAAFHAEQEKQLQAPALVA